MGAGELENSKFGLFLAIPVHFHVIHKAITKPKKKNLFFYSLLSRKSSSLNQQKMLKFCETRKSLEGIMRCRIIFGMSRPFVRENFLQKLTTSLPAPLIPVPIFLKNRKIFVQYCRITLVCGGGEGVIINFMRNGCKNGEAIKSCFRFFRAPSPSRVRVREKVE